MRDIQKTAARSRETTVCHAHEYFYGERALYTTKYLREILFLILTENSIQFCGNNYRPVDGTAMGTKMAVAFAGHFPRGYPARISSDGPGVFRRCSNGGKNQNPRQSLRLSIKPQKVPGSKLTPKKSMPNFRALKISRKY